MIDLTQELEALARRGGEGADERFAGEGMRQQLREHIARGRRRVNGLAIAAAALLAVAATTVATPPEPTTTEQPSPTPTASASVEAPAELLPGVYTRGYLAQMRGMYSEQGSLPCTQIPDVQMSTDGSPFPGFMAGLPQWIEINRIYGVANELAASYPIPLYPRDGSGRYNQSLLSIPKLYPANAQVVVTLIAEDGNWWAFTASYGVRDSMPFDRPGMFVSLTPNAECSGGFRSANGAPIPPGVYAARQMTGPGSEQGRTIVRDLGYVQIVTGLPSIPQLNVTQ